MPEPVSNSNIQRTEVDDDEPDDWRVLLSRQTSPLYIASNIDTGTSVYSAQDAQVSAECVHYTCSKASVLTKCSGEYDTE